MEFLQEFNIPAVEHELNTFLGRLLYGECGEKAVYGAFYRSVITCVWADNKPLVWRAVTVIEGDLASVLTNQKNGDLMFVNPDSGEVEFIDVKCTGRISVASLNNFRRDGWFWINAYVISDGRFYGMVRNNQAFQNWLRSHEMEIIGDKEFYRVNYNELRLFANTDEGADIELYKHMDPDGYRTEVIGKIRVELEKFGLKLFQENTKPMVKKRIVLVLDDDGRIQI